MSKVAIVVPYYPPALGGVEKYAQRIAHALRDSEGVEPVVVTIRKGWRTRRDERDGVAVVEIGGPFSLSATRFNPLWVFSLPRLFRKLGVDVINAHAPVPGLAELVCFRSAGRPVVMTYHSGTMAKGTWTDPLLKAWERWVLPRAFARAAALIAAGPVSLAYKTGRAVVIAPGVSTELFQPASGERERSVTFVGRIESASRWKGVQVLIEALPQLVELVPDVMVDMLGDGDDVPVFRERAEELGVSDHLRWHGGVTEAQVAAQLAKTSVSVVPSITEAECNPTVLIEAFASGVPVVGSDIGGIPFNIRHGVNGLLVPPEDASSLAEALAAIVSDAELADRMGAAARETALAEFDFQKGNAKTLEILRSVVGARR